jgi:hypothetical protein
MKRKTKDTLKILSGILFLGITSNTLLAFPRDGYSSDGARERRGHGGFMLGVCVGQTLAQQGIGIDQIDENSLQTAVETCKEKRGVTPAQPSPAPSEPPAADPSPSPAPMGSPTVPASQ